MESAALVILCLRMGLASSMSVLFGWQPMPDGNQVEYIVQIEPELAATMRAGQSIPITSDIPDDIGPVGRIRIVVGRDELPREKLATEKLTTELKPWPVNASTKKQPRDGILETQYRVQPVEGSTAGRYGAQAAGTGNSQILPPSENAATANPFAKSLQQGAQQARNLAADAKQILPPADELFGAGTTGVQNAINNTTNQLSNGLQQGVAQVADRGSQLVREKLDQYGRSPSNQRSILSDGNDTSNSKILPPGSAPNSQINNGQITPKGRRIDQPIDQQPRRDWQRGNPVPPSNFAADSTPPQTNPTSQPGVFNAPWPATTAPSTTEASVRNPTGRNGYPADSIQGNGYQGGQSAATASSWPNNQKGADAFDVANRQTSNPPAMQNGPAFPKMSSQQQPDRQNGNGTWPASPTTPAITAEMMHQPASSNNLQTASSTQGYQQQTAARQPLGSQSVGAQPGVFGSGQGNNYAAGSTESSNKSLFPLLLSWVLLSGSGAGNLYLFWSYLDVRSKYQGVVHGSPRRRDRYDD